MLEPPVRARIDEFFGASIGAQVAALGSGGLPSAMSEVDRSGIADVARSGSRVSLLVAGYGAIHRTLWRHWNNEVRARELGQKETEHLIDMGGEFLFDYAAWLAAELPVEFEGARNEAFRSPSERQVDAICSLLDGGPFDKAAIEHPIDAHHLAVVGHGPDFREHLSALAARMDCRLLVLDVLPDPKWAWLTRTRPLEAVDLASWPDRVNAEFQLGIGSILEGPAGFRESHERAASAYKFSADDSPVVSFSDISVVDLAATDECKARGFIADELGPLMQMGDRGDALLETLSCYLDCGSNARRAARELTIHHQTVAQRIRAVQRQLGVPIADRALELHLALRLRGRLGSE